MRSLSIRLRSKTNQYNSDIAQNSNMSYIQAGLADLKFMIRPSRNVEKQWMYGTLNVITSEIKVTWNFLIHFVKRR